MAQHDQPSGQGSRSSSLTSLISQPPPPLLPPNAAHRDATPDEQRASTRHEGSNSDGGALTSDQENSASQKANASSQRRSSTSRQNNRRKPKNNKRQLRPHEVYQRQVYADLFTTPDYRKFYVIQSISGESLAEIHMLKANAAIVSALNGKPKRISPLRDGKLLVEVSSYEQSQKITSITRLVGTRVEVEEHGTLNQSRGTIRNKNIIKYTDEEILFDLQQQNSSAIKTIFRIEKKMGRNRTATSNDELVKQATGTFIITFDTPHLPSSIRLGWIDLEVREYIQSPRRCFNCQRFGHGARSCRETRAFCVNCGQEAHGPCTNVPKCRNCDNSHQASSKDCFYYQMEQEVITTMVRQKLPYGQAKKEVFARYSDTTMTYARAVTSGAAAPHGAPTATRAPPTSRAPSLQSSNNNRNEQSAPTSDSQLNDNKKRMRNPSGEDGRKKQRQVSSQEARPKLVPTPVSGKQQKTPTTAKLPAQESSGWKPPTTELPPTPVAWQMMPPPPPPPGQIFKFGPSPSPSGTKSKPESNLQRISNMETSQSASHPDEEPASKSGPSPSPSGTKSKQEFNFHRISTMETDRPPPHPNEGETLPSPSPIITKRRDSARRRNHNRSQSFAGYDYDEIHN